MSGARTTNRRSPTAGHSRVRQACRADREGPRQLSRDAGPALAACVAGYTLVDVAHKVVGVSSVGLRSYVALLEGSSPTDDVIFLQLKQARRSVVARYVHGESARHAHQGQRVVEYQQALQTVSDPLLGWTTIDGPAVRRPPVPRHEGHDSRSTTSKPGALKDYARILGEPAGRRGMRAQACASIVLQAMSVASTRLDTAH